LETQGQCARAEGTWLTTQPRGWLLSMQWWTSDFGRTVRPPSGRTANSQAELCCLKLFSRKRVHLLAKEKQMPVDFRLLCNNVWIPMFHRNMLPPS
jgi:hypothetical protein